MRKIKVLVKKEVLDILRDRKTLIMMVVIPLLLYPVIMIGMTVIMGNYMKAQSEKEFSVGYSQEDEAFAQQLIMLRDNENDSSANIVFEQKPREDVDAYFSCEEQNGTLQITIDYISTDQDSEQAMRGLEDLLDQYRDKMLADNLSAEGLTEEFLHPLEYISEDEASESESIGMGIGGSIGMMLVVTILLGALYPAIDATTGEKERGTLETLLTLPVTNFEMIISKYISVSIFACITAVLSLLSLGGSVLFMVYGFSTDIVQIGEISISTLLVWIPVMAVAMITTALLITAFCMCFCVFAKSFKEANNYVTPVMLVFMFASMVSMVPSIRLSYSTALIPIVNISLLVKEVAAQNLELALAGITIGVNFAYSVLVVWVLAKMYDSENILFADGFQSFQLFQKRSEIKEGTVPDTGDLVLTFVVLLLFMLYIGGAVSVRNPFAGVVVQQFMILIMPLLTVWYLKSDKKNIFALSLPRKGIVVASVLLYAGVFLLNYVLSDLLSMIFKESTQNVEMTFQKLIEQPVILLLLVIAVMPAIGEELLFRGLLYESLRYKAGVLWAVIGSSLIFGIFHASLAKMLPTFLLGSVFAYIVSVSGSIYIGTVLHFLNNAISVIIMKYPDKVVKWVPFLAEETPLASELLLMTGISVVLIAAGAFLCRRQAKKQ